MTDSRRARVLLPIVAAALVAAGPAGAAGDYVGQETCAVCHEDVVKAFGMTPHAAAPGWDPEKGCESCHGPGSEHADAGGDIEKIVRPATLPAQEASKICLGCHQKQEAQFTFHQSFHALNDVSCLDCHDPHSTAEHLLPKTGPALCGKCHQAIVAQFDLPRAHPIPQCEKCHDPHAPQSLRTDTTLYNEVCTSCHFDKEGPFVFEHDVIRVDGCIACHEVHGSPNRHLLKHALEANLCYQCHPGTQTPTFHSLPTFLNEKCVACHTAIHGSNTNPFFLEE